MHLGEHAFAFDDLGAAHVSAHAQPLPDEIVQSVMNRINEFCLLS